MGYSMGVVVFGLLLSAGQKWRFAPVLGLLALMPVIAIIVVLVKHGKADKPHKKESTSMMVKTHDPLDSAKARPRASLSRIRKTCVIAGPSVKRSAPSLFLEEK